MYKGLMKELKSAGRGDTTSNDEVAKAHIEKIFQLLAVLEKLMETDKTSEEYQDLLKKLPIKYIDCYHELIQMGAHFIICLIFCRRGNENFDSMPKDFLKKIENPDDGSIYFAQAKSEAKKNHKTDSEDLRKGGVIPFLTNPQGLNLGRYMELFMEKLSGNKNLFQRPMRAGKKNNIHDPKVTVYFENSKVGPHTIPKLLPKLSEALGLPHLTNCQLRPSGMQSLNRAGIDDRAIMSVSGHKCLSTLKHYVPNQTHGKKIQMVAAICGPLVEAVPTR
jgi:hypothetical protein